MNQRIVYAIAKEVAVDLLGHREMHVRRASLPVVASSRVPVCLDVQRGGFTPPLHSQALSRFSSPDSGDFRRPVVIDPARILCVAGYLRCIGIVPVHVFPATFLVALASVITSSVCYPQFQLDVSARRWCWGDVVARARRAPAERDADRAACERRSTRDKRTRD